MIRGVIGTYDQRSLGPRLSVSAVPTRNEGENKNSQFAQFNHNIYVQYAKKIQYVEKVAFATQIRR